MMILLLLLWYYYGTYPAMQVQCAVMICPSLFTPIQAWWKLSGEAWLGFTFAISIAEEEFPIGLTLTARLSSSLEVVVSLQALPLHQLLLGIYARAFDKKKQNMLPNSTGGQRVIPSTNFSSLEYGSSTSSNLSFSRYLSFA